MSFIRVPLFFRVGSGFSPLENFSVEISCYYQISLLIYNCVRQSLQFALECFYTIISGEIHTNVNLILYVLPKQTRYQIRCLRCLYLVYLRPRWLLFQVHQHTSVLCRYCSLISTVSTIFSIQNALHTLVIATSLTLLRSGPLHLWTLVSCLILQLIKPILTRLVFKD